MEELLKQILGEIKSIKNEVQDIKVEVQNLKTGQQQIIEHIDNLEGQTRENTDIIKAIQHNTEATSAKVDGLTVNTASKTALATLSKNVDDIGSDLSFLVRKAAKHDDDIRQLRQAQ